MISQFDIRDLVSRAFGDYISLPHPAFVREGILKKSLSLPGKHTLSEILSGARPYFMTLSFRYKGKSYDLPNEPLVALSLKKTIVETATLGKYRKGKVKEYITTEDYNINIRGVCINEESPEDYPAEQVKQIKDLFELNDAVEVAGNAFFELFGIERVVLKDLNIAEMPGSPNLQKYSIAAVSDVDFLAELDEKRNLLK